MKIILTIFLLTISNSTVWGQFSTNLINHVAIGDRGISFSISDEKYEKDEIKQLFDLEIVASAPLFWILQNTTNRDANVHFEGIDHAFAFKLYDYNGQEVPLSDYGKSMSVGPINYSNRIFTGIRFIGVSKNGVSIRDFPSVDKLFNISNSGGYLLEVKYWHSNLASKELKWELSEPVRLKVVKK